MNRPISPYRKALLLQVLRGEMTPEAAAGMLGVSRRAVTDMRRRYLRSKLPKIEGSLKAPLDAPVDIRRDRWGVAHIRARSTADCYTALGYAMAQDRLWQLDYMRRLARGRLAEILGAGYLSQDRLHRTIGLSRSAEEAAADMPDEVALVLTSLAAGINAGMSGCADCLPVEFDLLDYAPEAWTPGDSIAVWKWRWWMLTGRLGNIAVKEAARRYLSPDLLDLFLSVEAGEETIVPGDEPAGVGGHDTGEGSNNWVVGGNRSVAGKPVLATDPHNAVDLCRQWYQAQITAPEVDAIGAFFLGTPGIYLGHTRRTAWGVTNHTASARDVYVETVSPDDPGMYREGDGWRPFEVERQEIPVRGRAAETLVIRRTARGPVVNDFVPQAGDEPDPPLSLRWVGAEPTTGFEAMLALLRSRSADEVLGALRQWPFPILNFVFADADGRIGYHVAGRIPKRAQTWHGYRPAGDAAHDWAGMHAFDDLPQLIDPARGWVATANNPPWGGTGPYLSLGDWSDGYRFRRIRQRIEGVDRHTIESVAAIQADATHGRAQELASVVAWFARASRDASLKAIGELLEAWDGTYGTDAAAPAVFTAFWEHWLRRVARDRFPESVVSLVAGRAGGVARRLLLGEDVGWFSENTDLGVAVVTALQDALGWLRKTVGPRRSQWRWGRLHRVTFAHPVSQNAALAGLFDVGPFETTGGTGTVRAAGFSTVRPFEVTGISTYRMTVDMANPARGCATAAGGQSGHPASPHYSGQSRLWIADATHPLLMDERDIEANLEGALTLAPGN